MVATPPDKDLKAQYLRAYKFDSIREMLPSKNSKVFQLEVAARFSRGNVSLQNSGIVDQEAYDFSRKELDEMFKKVFDDKGS